LSRPGRGVTLAAMFIRRTPTRGRTRSRDGTDYFTYRLVAAERVGERVRAHLFISVLAYHLVHTIRWRLKAHGIDPCWATLRAQLAHQRRVTATLNDRDGATWHIRQAMRPEPEERAIFDALGLDHHPGATRKQRVA